MSPASICPHTCLDKTKLAQQGLERKKRVMFKEKEQMSAFKLYRLRSRTASEGQAAGR